MKMLVLVRILIFFVWNLLEFRVRSLASHHIAQTATVLTMYIYIQNSPYLNFLKELKSGKISSLVGKYLET